MACYSITVPKSKYPNAGNLFRICAVSLSLSWNREDGGNQDLAHLSQLQQNKYRSRISDP
ncbi:hypothetical protein PORCAN_1686 [Porphyromonas crevioricanis JCM 13913]|nr:hypothetical protein PORCAN_1686 [Porphyromonas crevioricanis JCM 13913]